MTYWSTSLTVKMGSLASIYPPPRYLYTLSPVKSLHTHPVLWCQWPHLYPSHPCTPYPFYIPLLIPFYLTPLLPLIPHPVPIPLISLCLNLVPIPLTLLCLILYPYPLHPYTHTPYTPYTLISLGPSPKTLVDFWRMVWQQRPPTIVMVTNLKEGNKTKCQQYWPESGSANFGPFKVTLTEHEVFADYSIRTIQVNVSSMGSVWV